MFHQLQCMRSFVAVVETGSFTRAAHALQAAPASVSEHVSSLERHLGASLLHRTTRALRLTEEGRAYLDLCRSVLGQIDDAERAIGTSPGTLSGVLTVELSDGVDAFLIDAIAAFRAAHPALQLHITGSNRQFDAAPGNADVTIRSVAPRGGEQGREPARQLGRSRTVFLAAPAYLDRHGVPSSPDDLLAHQCIGYLDPHSGRLWEWYFAAKGRSFARALPCPVAIGRGDLRRRAAAAGMGVINDVVHFAAPFIRSGALVPVLEEWTMPLPICHLAINRDRHRPARVEAFVAHLHDWLDALPADSGAGPASAG